MVYNTLYHSVMIGNKPRIGKNCDLVLHPGCTATIGDGWKCNRNVTLAVQRNASIVIGKNVGFGNGCEIVCHGKIEIGDNTLFGPNVMVYDHNHEFSFSRGVNRTHYEIGEVIIGNNCWIGANAVLLKDVHIGDNVIIGAGSVVTKDIPSNCIATGIPAKVIKTKDNEL